MIELVYFLIVASISLVSKERPPKNHQCHVEDYVRYVILWLYNQGGTMISVTSAYLWAPRS